MSSISRVTCASGLSISVKTNICASAPARGDTHHLRDLLLVPVPDSAVERVRVRALIVHIAQCNPPPRHGM